MLYLLTGEVQTGKTRWLEALAEDLTSRGVCCWGFLSPGIWRETVTNGNTINYEKRGIEALLLPQRTRLAFAKRADLARETGEYSSEWASVRANLGWAISDEALSCVNEHLASMCPCDNQAQPGLLVIDEIGRLELKFSEGLTKACELLEAGPNSHYQHALVVARESLATMVQASFEKAWGGSRIIFPCSKGKSLLFEEYTQVECRG